MLMSLCFFLWLGLLKVGAQLECPASIDEREVVPFFMLDPNDFTPFRECRMTDMVMYLLKCCVTFLARRRISTVTSSSPLKRC